MATVNYNAHDRKVGDIIDAHFAQDLYDVLGMNTNHCTQQEFFDKYVMDDNAFMISDEGRNKQVIYFDDYTITIKRNK